MPGGMSLNNEALILRLTTVIRSTVENHEMFIRNVSTQKIEEQPNSTWISDLLRSL